MGTTRVPDSLFGGPSFGPSPASVTWHRTTTSWAATFASVQCRPIASPRRIPVNAMRWNCLAPGSMEALNPRRMRVMAAPRKYPDELRERATRMAVEARRDPATRAGALARIGKQPDIRPETLRNWVTRGEIDGFRPGTTTEEAGRISELEREVRELRRANEILKTASADVAQAELDRRLK